MSDQWEVFTAGDGQPGIRAVDWQARAERAEARLAEAEDTIRQMEQILRMPDHGYVTHARNLANAFLGSGSQP